MSSKNLIGEFLEVGRRFRRSISLERDYREALQNGGYIVTPTAREVLHRLVEGLANGSHSRAWTLTGPYGVGKSAFAVFLTRVFCSDDESGSMARTKLREADSQLCNSLDELGIYQEGRKGMLPILATARRVSASCCIMEAISSAMNVDNNEEFKRIGSRLRSVLEKADDIAQLDTRLIIDILDSVVKAAKAAGYTGIILIIDELGKLFEYAARYPQKGDVYVLQELAEYSARSGNFPVLSVGLLHQSFEEYGRHLDLGTRREWAKIQGRFEDMVFLEPPEQLIRMIGKAIRWTKERPKELEERVRGIISNTIKGGIVPPGMPNAEFEQLALDAYPLHPLTLVALPYLFRRFAQNERSLFSYLSSMEPHGFQEFISTRYLDSNEPIFIRPSDMFDYFIINYGLGLYRQPHALRWLEAADVLEQKDDLGLLQRVVVKTIGILGALGEFCHLRASIKMISIAIQDNPLPDADLEYAIGQLKDQSIITHRSFNDTYRIWEGSDVDIEERIAEGERSIRYNLGLADSVRKFTSSKPMIARRHSFETGAMRSFEILYVDSPEDIDQYLEAETALDGKIIVCLAESTQIAQSFIDIALTRKISNLVFAIPQMIGELRGAVLELGSLRWVWDNTPELRDDRVARREIAIRITEAEQLLLRALNGLLDPREDPVGSVCLWFYNGKQQNVRTLAGISQLLSNVCDRLYSSSPKIKNELIVRRSLSSAAAAARRNLIEAMLTHSEEPMLGIDGYPPERSMYESVLRATGLHRPIAEDRWGFARPNTDNLVPSWDRLFSLVFERQPEPVSLTALYSELSRPPYGVLDGLHPVLLCAFLLAYPDETTLYREGTFIPEPGIADFEVLLKRPEFYAIAGSRVEGGRAAIVERLAKGLQVRAATVPIVRALFRMVKGLPDFTWKTHRLSEKTIMLREAFEKAKSPERFLYLEMPIALGLEPFSQRSPKASDVDAFFNALNSSLQEWADAMPKAHRIARGILLRACGFEPNDMGWQELKKQCSRIEPIVTEPQLLAFVRRVNQSDSDFNGIDSVLSLVANRPLRNWSDVEVERFPEVARSIGVAFQGAVKLSEQTGQPVDEITSLSSEEEKKVQRILMDLRRHITGEIRGYSPRIVRIALAQLLKEIDKLEREIVHK